MIVTVTPNPALDLTYSLAGAASGDVDVNRALGSTLEASGKGVNVSRALANAGLDTCAVLPAGGPAGRALVELLDDDGVAHLVTRQAGETRINTTAVWAGGATLKLNGPGAALTDAERRDLLDQTARALDDARSTTEGTVWLAVCGSLPPAVGPELIAEFVDVARRYGARCAVDASGAALSAALDAGADLLAPNRSELADVTSSIPPSGSIGELAGAASALSRRTGSALLISLGPRGALHADGGRVLHGEGPPLTPVNTAGAGDALLAGWLAGDGDPDARLSRAITWSRSACLRDTTVDSAPGRGDTAAIAVVDLSP
ncbi:1-phosphofructokinase family hexose kinase [Mycolicibacterium sediminis]|uniref:1-phosphofructokinase n=1 Tax=Mycolicibacterium sediminis TaxID=1286180 RepID=A0A7I7QKS4_9MYCO|nr:PfkB family carbohydrate kinase [Mycolicibacterium sediminis]BBY26948.1 1-phosphofructokinase [Mycolicibacterium sediminis]